MYVCVIADCSLYKDGLRDLSIIMGRGDPKRGGGAVLLLTKTGGGGGVNGLNMLNGGG